jgi:hypothetical protein
LFPPANFYSKYRTSPPACLAALPKKKKEADSSIEKEKENTKKGKRRAYEKNQSCGGAPHCKQQGMFTPPLQIPLK